MAINKSFSVPGGASDTQLYGPVEITALAYGLPGSTAINDPYGIKCLWRAVDYRREEVLPEFQQVCHAGCRPNLAQIANEEA